MGLAKPPRPILYYGLLPPIQPFRQAKSCINYAKFHSKERKEKRKKKHYAKFLLPVRSKAANEQANPWPMGPTPVRANQMVMFT